MKYVYEIIVSWTALQYKHINSLNYSRNSLILLFA